MITQCCQSFVCYVFQSYSFVSLQLSWLQFHFRVLPGVPYELKYNLFPLVAGHVNLPKLNFTLIGYPDPIDPVLQKMLPTHIFIKVKSSLLITHLYLYQSKSTKVLQTIVQEYRFRL